MRLGRYAVVDAREPAELNSREHTISNTYADISAAYAAASERVKRTGRPFVVVQAIAIVSPGVPDTPPPPVIERLATNRIGA